MKRKFRVLYWLNGNIKTVQVTADSKYNAKRMFYVNHDADDIIRIEEVTE